MHRILLRVLLAALIVAAGNVGAAAAGGEAAAPASLLAPTPAELLLAGSPGYWNGFPWWGPFPPPGPVF